MTTETLNSRLNSYTPIALSVFRAVFGLLFILHGSTKMFGWPLGSAVPIGAWPSWWAGLIELIAGVLIAVGLFTRIAAFIASGEMAVAYFWMHWPFPEGASFWPGSGELGGNGGEAALLFCFAFLLLVFTGGGTYAVDEQLARSGVRGRAGAPAREGSS